MRHLAIAALALFALSGCTATTESTEVGVRTVKASLFGPRGVEETVYPQGGTYFFLRPLSDWDVFDVGIQNLVMVREHGDGGRRSDDSLRFKTIDGNDVSVNVTMAWSILPDKAPYLVQFVGQGNEEVEEQLVRPVSRAVVRDVLNQLTSEEYYRASRRFETAEEARERLNSVLEPEGVTIHQVLLGEHKFNGTYEQIIKDKKVAEQEAERLVSETEASAAERHRDLERARGKVQKAIEEALGSSRKRELEGEAIYFERQKQAEAILAEKRASAEGLREQARALAGSGGKQMVKLRIAEALQGKDIVFIPAGSGMDLRTTDINALLGTYGVKALAE